MTQEPMRYIALDPGRTPDDQPVAVGPFETESDALTWAAGRTGAIYTLLTVEQFDALDAESTPKDMGWSVADEGVIDGVQHVTVLDEEGNPWEYEVTAAYAEREYGLTLANHPYPDGHCGA